jgi:endonuclease YncB( thermonuclease family)
MLGRPRIDAPLDVFITAMHRLLLGIIVLVAGLAIVPAAQARLKTGSCLVPNVSSTCAVWTAKATFIGDGDTIYVDVDGDGSSRRYSVRMTGINATEQTVYAANPAQRRGECHSLEATARLEQLIRKSHWRVRLAAQDPASHSRQRMRRWVAVKRNGRWQDAGRILVSEGLALWLPSRVENAWNTEYSTLAQRAATLGRGLWDTDYCGVGPSQTSPLQLWANTDDDERGNDDVNEEWMKIRNLDPVNAVPLGGWWVRDSQLRRYTIPSWVTLPPGETLTVFVGEGEDTFTELFWGRQNAVFDNAGAGELGLGDGAYLFDPQGDLRAWMQYPCRLNCADPNTGAIEISARDRKPEHVTLRNVSAQAVDLATYRLSSPPFSYAFSRDAVLNPGEEMEVEIEGDPAQDTRLLKYWGETGPILDNRGDVIRLETFTGIQIGCYAYGSKVC